jgi:Na+-transporting methylmalonyl-CoA/oxaloacetate decarboxylase gamma subunit
LGIGMYLVAIGWLYVVLMMAVAEALSTQGSVLGAVITFVFYGLLPLAVVMYIMGTPTRRRARLAAEAAEAAAASSATAPDGSGQAAGDTVAAERKEG